MERIIYHKGDEDVNEKWMEELNYEALPETLPDIYQELASVIGVKSLIHLTSKFGGMRIYIPKKDKLMQNIRDSKIRKEYPDKTYKELARKYNLSESRIREILSEKELDGQISFCDL